MTSGIQFVERRIPRAQGSLYAQDYEGSGPPFLLMHGFPDNLHIYDDLVPFLVKGQRRVVAFRSLPAGHWLQSDVPESVAQELLS